MLKYEEIWRVLDNLIGNIEPVGETNADNRSFERLKVAEYLTDYLIDKIASVLPNIKRPEYSMKRAGENARAYMVDLRDLLNERLKYLE